VFFSIELNNAAPPLRLHPKEGNIRIINRIDNNKVEIASFVGLRGKARNDICHSLRFSIGRPTPTPTPKEGNLMTYVIVCDF
jgi:hypothetical protein